MALSRRGAESQVLPLLLARAAARARVCALPVLGSKRARTHGSRARQRGGAAVRDSQCSQPFLFRLGWPRCGNLWWRGSAAWTRGSWPSRAVPLRSFLALSPPGGGRRGRPGAQKTYLGCANISWYRRAGLQRRPACLIGYCKQPGHDKRTCPQKKTDEAVGAGPPYPRHQVCLLRTQSNSLALQD